MRNEGIGSWPARRLRGGPQQPAIVFEGREITYQEVHARSVRLANAMRDLGVGHGSRVAYLGSNHPSFAETLFALGMLGAVLVPLNPRLAHQEHAYILNDAGATLLIWAEKWGSQVAALQAETPLQRAVSIEATDDTGYEAFVAAGSEAPVDEEVSLDDVCMIQYTSGTTGRPKGVMLTHGNLTWNSINMLIDIDFTTDEVMLLAAPMFHSAGMNNSFLTTVLKGGTVVMMGEWRPDNAIELIERHHVTHMLGVPTMFISLAQAQRWPTADFSSLRTLTCGSAPLPDALIHTYRDRGLTILQGYGMTEASANATFQRTGSGHRKPGSVGAPCFFTDLRIVDAHGEDVGAGGKGEVLLQGPNLMRGYWELPQATADAMDDGGWLRTGDVAMQDRDGAVYIADRIKEMIISGGENIYPAEVEDALYRHPAVVECAVVGVKDDHWGEVGHAVVVVREGASVQIDELRAHMRKELAAYKVPKTFRFVDRLPRNATGKLVKERLRGDLANSS